jgi:hypothetical protein
MRPRINLALPALVFACLGGCTSFESEYERGVYDYEPIYCYQTLGGIDCHRQPHHRDAGRLVNYYGPAPSKYDAPEPRSEPPRSSTKRWRHRRGSPSGLIRMAASITFFIPGPARAHGCIGR